MPGATDKYDERSYDYPRPGSMETTGYIHILRYMQVEDNVEALHFYNEAADLREIYEVQLTRLVARQMLTQEQKLSLANGAWRRYCKGFKKLYNKRIKNQPQLDFESIRPGDPIPKVDSEINVKGPTRKACADIMAEIIRPFLAQPVLFIEEPPTVTSGASPPEDSGPTSRKKNKGKKKKAQ